MGRYAGAVGEGSDEELEGARQRHVPAAGASTAAAGQPVVVVSDIVDSCRLQLDVPIFHRCCCCQQHEDYWEVI